MENSPDATAVQLAEIAREICDWWGLTTAETEALVGGETSAAAVIRIAYLL